MEYITRCVCGKKAILDSKHEIKAKNGRIQRMNRCASCKNTTRQTIIGLVVKRYVLKDAKFPLSEKREFSGKIDSLRIRWLMQPLNVLATSTVS